MATHYSTIHNYNNNNNDRIQMKPPPSLEEQLKMLPEFSSKRCIYRVPRHIRMANEGAYTPFIVSIGPLHHRDDHLQATKFHKLKYLQSYLHRSHTGLELKGFLDIVRKNESRIRGYYADPMVDEIGSEELVSMVLVDAIFLIELLCRNHKPGELIKEDDQMFNRPRMVTDVARDICLEENQLPFFILCELYDAAGLNQVDSNLNFIDMASDFLRVKKNPDGSNTYIGHFLDLLRFGYLPTKLRDPSRIDIDQSTDQSCSGCIPWKIPGSTCLNCGNEDGSSKIKLNNFVCKTATALREAGVKFSKANDSSEQLDIKFDRNKGTLSIPEIVVASHTVALFKNLAVFEQCHYFHDAYIIDYLSFLDFLINTPEDVALLAKKGIIVNMIGSDERVADFFNGLNKYVKTRVDNFYYAEQIKELNKYYNRPWNRHRAVLRHKYFNHPWATISVIYAVVLLLLTVLQAATGVIPAIPSKH